MKNIFKKLFHRHQAKEQSIAEEAWTNSANYWENRYLTGGNSGIGSYGRLAQFKAEIINQFVKDNNIKTVIEWGCGDGNQLGLADYPQYTGYDVSNEAINICREKFKDDTTKRFIHCGGLEYFPKETAELTLSLDVLYHLIEDDIYASYMKRLFATSSKYVCIYSCNDNVFIPANHVKQRIFTQWVDDNVAAEWHLVKHIPNRFPYDPNDPETSWSDFYFYEKTGSQQ
ncbi:MAG: class I SAM-dependent methyltransferase [Bacteroidales bacterium]|nr:class I SAM-dependent methyltransferase [Bacteroidales bacterium]